MMVAVAVRPGSGPDGGWLVALHPHPHPPGINQSLNDQAYIDTTGK